MGQQPGKIEDTEGGIGALPSSSIASGTGAARNSSSLIGFAAVLSVARNARTPPPASWAFQLLPGLYNQYQKVAVILRRFDSTRVHPSLPFPRDHGTAAPLGNEKPSRNRRESFSARGSSGSSPTDLRCVDNVTRPTVRHLFHGRSSIKLAMSVESSRI